MTALVADMLTSQHLSHPIIQEIGRLLIADSEFNVWVYDVAKKLDLTEEEWARVLTRASRVSDGGGAQWQCLPTGEACTGGTFHG